MAELSALFRPLRIGSLTLPNRIIMPALTTFYDFEGGDRYADFFAERARGGAGLIILGALQALYPGRAGVSGWVPDEEVLEKGPVKLNHDLYIPRLQNWTWSIHRAGGLCAAQVAVYGYWAKGGYGAEAEEVSPSGVVLEGEEFRPGLEKLTFVRGGRPLETEEIPHLVQEIGRAAHRAKEAGFDAVELQSLGGNLLSRFLSPATNKRGDRYGGSLENRARFLLEAVAEIKDRLGADYPLLVRLNGRDFIPGGMEPEDYQELAPMLEAAGVHAIDLMPGWYETRRPMNQMCVERGAFIQVAEALKQACSIPVAANIRINDPLLAEEAVSQGRADLVAMCSPLIADPELPKKARQGRTSEIRMCTACCNCWSDIAQRFSPLGCSVNARAGYESSRRVERAAEPQKVLVVGGGPGGMEAARVAAERGHRVTLVERADRLGGQLLYAALPPHKEEWSEFVGYLSASLDRLGVEVMTGTEATADYVLQAAPETLVLATGAEPIIPDWPGMDGPNVAGALEVLKGEFETGPRVVIVGGGLVGCETAEKLVQEGRRVTIVEMLPRIGADIDLWNRWVVLDRLAKAGVEMRPGFTVTGITPSGIEAAGEEGPVTLAGDSVVIAVGSKPVDDLAGQLGGKVGKVFSIGDCVEPRRVKQAVEEGFLAACRI